MFPKCFKNRAAAKAVQAVGVFMIGILLFRRLNLLPVIIIVVWILIVNKKQTYNSYGSSGGGWS